MRCLPLKPLQATQSRIVIAGNLLIDTSKVVDMVDTKANGIVRDGHHGGQGGYQKGGQIAGHVA